ncbi:N-hydroxyarylamine O-acetyltransferase [Bacillus sp. OV322]|uniref:arylamine N-acetyltransferase family protein n=1 Tax=Bacillus sp. OV322 TaxID=1882764 RepID=UPI0008E55582|nr:arylamine N-acetyltransferase [Bacillus sp. OV322]SFB99161.1 N-hydroxyarylamine O-acetyltransferase [Bacillus sp. OV322]
MSNLNTLFRRRIGFPEHEEITFEKLDIILEKTAKSIPFENLCIIGNRTTYISKDHLINKLLTKNEGGLCYELNALLYFFLAQNGFDITLVRGVIFNQQKQRWNTIGKTHVTNLITHNGQVFLADTGFGGNLPLRPVPLTGETTSSATGEFCVKKEESDYGEYIFYMKLRDKDKEWKKGYAFDSAQAVEDAAELNDVQKIILEHPESPFNKKKLITMLTDRGNATLTESSFTVWRDGKSEKKEVGQKEFTEIAKKYFGLSD